MGHTDGEHVCAPLCDLWKTNAPDLSLDRTSLQLIRELRIIGVDTEDVPRLCFSQGLEEGVKSGSELAGDAGGTTSQRRCIGVLVFTLFFVDIAKSGCAFNRVLPAGGGCSHGFHRLLSGNNGIFIPWMSLDSNSFGGEETLDEGVDRARILPTRGVRVPPQQGDKVRAKSVNVPVDETFGRVGDRSTIVIDGERRESGSVGISKLEGRVAVPSLREGLDHGVISLLRGPACLVVHDVNQTTWSMLEKAKTFGVIEVRDLRDEMSNSFGSVLRNVGLEQTLLNEILKSFICEVDAELIEGVGATSHVLWSRKIEQTDEGDKVVAT